MSLSYLFEVHFRMTFTKNTTINIKLRILEVTDHYVTGHHQQCSIDIISTDVPHPPVNIGDPQAEQTMLPF